MDSKLQINLGQIPVYIINLDESRERWIQCYKRFSSILPKGNLQRIPAINGKDWANATAIDRWNPGKLGQLQAESYVGRDVYPDPIRAAICLSHQRALRRLVSDCRLLPKEPQWALILEDDALPAATLLSVLSDDLSIEIPSDAEVLFLHDRLVGTNSEGCHGTLGNTTSLFWKQVVSGVGLEGYLVSLDGAAKMLSAWRPLYMECDIQLGAFWKCSTANQLRARLSSLASQESWDTTKAIVAYVANPPLVQIDEGIPSDKFRLIESIAIADARSPNSSEPCSTIRNKRWDNGCPLAFVSCWFNPAHFRSRVENALRFLEQPYLPNLVIVELAFGDDDWQLPDDTPNLIRLRSNTVCWQKEALLNHGLTAVAQENVDYLGWIDADVLVPIPSWKDHLVDALSKKRLCQIFESIETRFPDRGPNVSLGSAAAWLHHQKHPTLCPITGFGWAMHKEIWQTTKLYDVGIVGGGDHVMWRSLFMNALGEETVFGNSPYPDSIGSIRSLWARRWADAIQLEIGYVACTKLATLPHGSSRDRNYNNRAQVLKEHNFAPVQHLERDGNGLLQWRLETPQALKVAVEKYFRNRNEDLQ